MHSASSSAAGPWAMGHMCGDKVSVQEGNGRPVVTSTAGPSQGLAHPLARSGRATLHQGRGSSSLICFFASVFLVIPFHCFLQWGFSQTGSRGHRNAVSAREGWKNHSGQEALPFAKAGESSSTRNLGPAGEDFGARRGMGYLASGGSGCLVVCDPGILSGGPKASIRAPPALQAGVPGDATQVEAVGTTWL